MVLISEIMEDAKKEGEPKEADGEQEDEEKAEEGLQEERDETEERYQEPAAVDRAELAAPPAEDPKEEASPPSGKMLYNDYALRVAYIMQSYLYMRQGGAAASRGASSGGGSAGEERCRAMMEVVRKESGRWAVSRVVLEHTHPLEPPPSPRQTPPILLQFLPHAYPSPHVSTLYGLPDSLDPAHHDAVTAHLGHKFCYVLVLLPPTSMLASTTTFVSTTSGPSFTTSSPSALVPRQPMFRWKPKVMRPPSSHNLLRPIALPPFSSPFLKPKT